MVRISVITPVYNSAHLIAETISSVLTQTYSEWEMIIVDDGSKDNITGVVSKFSEKNQRIKLFHQPNSGASAARNTGIKNSNYEWLLFLDADDYIGENYFEKMISVLEKDKSVDVVHCGWTRIAKDGMTTKANYGGEESDMFASLSYHCPFAIHCCIVRKTLVEQVGGFDTSFKTCGDWDFWQRIARSGAHFQMVKDVMAFYKTTSNSLSSDGNQFCINGLQVISQAYTKDPRVPDSKPEYINGMQTNDLPFRKYYFVAWCAGLLIGACKSASHLLEHLNAITAKNLDASCLADSLLDSIIIPAKEDQGSWHQHWFMIEKNLEKFLDDLERQSESVGLSNKAIALIERHVIKESMGRKTQLQIGKSRMLVIDVESQMQDLHFAEEVERFYGVVQLKGKILGLIELPLTNTFLTSFAIKDAIATKFSWKLLQCFFSLTVYPRPKITGNENLSEEEFHDKNGWEFFLQELWRKPDWTEKMFYNPDTAEENKADAISVDDSINIEVSESIPAIKTKSSSLSISYFASGAFAGKTNCDVRHKKVSPQKIRAAINSSSGYEICRIVVREALIGEKMDCGLNLCERLKKRKWERT